MTTSSLDSILAALRSTPIRDAGELRSRLVPDLLAFIAEGRAAAEKQLLADQDGLTCARALCRDMDQVVRTIYDAVVEHLYAASNTSLGERVALVATGGYGRGTLAPGSDVDLLFLLPYKQTAWSESVVEAMLYVLWDLKLKIGHATRSVDECLREASSDMTIRTSLLESRFLFGDEALFENLMERFDRDLVAASAPAFVDAKLKERDARVAKAGASRYLVEPNVKDGKGGLRDLNTLFWISKYVYRVRQPEELVRAGLFTQDEFQLFARCEEFLWRVRCHLHFVTGRAEERLTFDVQRRIAERIGYKARGGLSGVERFMKAYFRIAKDVGDLTAIVCAELEARQTKKLPVLNRVFDRFRRKRGGAFAVDDFIIDNNRINVLDEDAFERDPANLIRLFWLADKHNLPINPDATRLATRSLSLIGPTLRKDPEANKMFLDILTSRNSPEVVLRLMNEAGVLGRFVPEFGRIVAMMQFNMYHHYTVDEHLLRAVGVLNDIESGRLGGDHPLAHKIVGTIRNRRALFVATFLHDIAKGRPDDHSLAGAAIARKLGPRFGLSDAETETVAWLVEHHLLMSNTAQSRDLSDNATIKAFADVVQTMERLKLLLVLTIADIKAVGPGVWTGWKGQLLRNLYHETEIVLGGGAVDIARSERVRLAQEELRTELPDWTSEQFDSYASRHSPGYWLKTDVTRRIKQARFVNEAEKAGRTVTTTYETHQFRGVTELTVLSPDHPRLLAIVTGACAAAGGNIVDAQIFTTTDGMALDTIVLSRAFDRDEDELRRAGRVANAIERALKGEVKIADLVDGKRPAPTRAKPFYVPPDVTIDNSLSNRQTVIEISGLDRPGLLYDLTTALGKLNLNIASAHIVTFGEKAVDVFYVTDLTGTKITHAGRQAAIQRSLLEVFKTDEREAPQRRSA
jgi:[protein-PII] uridylyltransferase